MLRISREKGGASRVTLKIEGRLVGRFVPLLARECRDHLDARFDIELDLTGLHYADPTGVELLEDLKRSGFDVVGATPLIRGLLRKRSDSLG